MEMSIGNLLILEIEYPDCTNYEGRKLLVFENVTVNDLIKQRSIDPHFSENKKYISPIARFRPNEEGWKDAVSFCSIKNKLGGKQ
jgi:hypothetical protein